ncbi:MAG: hypothetical protein ACQEP1_02810 [Nanobdellota archaeon]
MTKKKVFLELAIYVLFTWFSIYLFSGLGISMMNIFDINTYVNLFNERILSLFLLLLSLGVATSIFFVAIRQLEDNHMSYAAVSSLIAIVPLFIFMDSMRYYSLLGLFYFLGILSVTKGVVNKEEKSPVASFGIGWSAVRKVFYIAAVGAFIASFVLVSANQDHFESEFKGIVVDSIKSKDSFTISRDQVRDMISQNNMTVSKEGIREMVEGSFPEMTTDQYIEMNFPNFDDLPESQQDKIRQKVDAYLSSEKYEQKRKEMIAERVEAMQENINDNDYSEAYVDKIYNRLNDQGYRENMADNARSMMDSMPLMKKVMAYLPIIISITIFSIFLFAELITSFAAGLVFMFHYYTNKR